MQTKHKQQHKQQQKQVSKLICGICGCMLRPKPFKVDRQMLDITLLMITIKR